MVLKKAERKHKGSLIKELDAAIALLARVRSMAAEAMAADKNPSKKEAPARTKRTLSPEGREAIVAAQRKRWAKAKRKTRQDK